MGQVTGQMNLNLMSPQQLLDHKTNGGEVPTVDMSKTIEAPRMRKYLPTLSDLVDRLTIVQQKAIFIHDHKADYMREMALIMHDIDLILSGMEQRISAREIHAIVVIMLTNRFIWENEGKARNGGNEQDHLLRLTHSINGVRNTAKNVLSEIDGGRKDYKVDALAASVIESGFGDWDVFS